MLMELLCSYEHFKSGAFIIQGVRTAVTHRRDRRRDIKGWHTEETRKCLFTLE